MEEKKECPIGDTIIEDVNNRSCHKIVNVDDVSNGDIKHHNCYINNTKGTVTNSSGSNSSNLDNQVNLNKEPNASLWGMRHVQALLLFCCFFVSFYMRSNISIAIVAMTDKNSSHSDFTVYNWTGPERGAVLSSFYGGYFLMLPLAGQLGLKYPSKLLLGLSLFEGSILSMITPFVVSFGGWKALCGLRVLLGINQDHCRIHLYDNEGTV